MNTHTRTPDVATTDRLHDGLPRRRRWSMAEVEQAVAAGILHEDERIELIDGDIIAMSPKGRHHEIVRLKLAFRWSRQCPDTMMLASEPGLQLAPDTTPEPDITIFPSNILPPDVTAQTVLLVVEVADSSFAYDMKTKAPLYARFGVREYWVIDARSLRTTIHRDPGAEGYADVREYGPEEQVEPLAAPMLGLKLSELGA